MTKPDRSDRKFAHEWAACMRTAMSILRDRDDAEDAVQEVFRKLPYDCLARMSEHERSRYLHRAARNEACAILRRQSRRLPLDDLPEAALVSDNPSPEEETARDQIRRRVRAMIDQLPARCREVMRLSVVEQRTKPEIADALAIGVKAVEKQVTRGHGHLRKMRKARFLADSDLSTKEDGGGTHG